MSKVDDNFIAQYAKLEMKLCETEQELDEFKKHFEFIYERVLNIHGENKNYDYMIKAKKLLGDMS